MAPTTTIPSSQASQGATAGTSQNSMDLPDSFLDHSSFLQYAMGSQDGGSPAVTFQTPRTVRLLGLDSITSFPGTSFSVFPPLATQDPQQIPMSRSAGHSFLPLSKGSSVTQSRHSDNYQPSQHSQHSQNTTENHSSQSWDPLGLCLMQGPIGGAPWSNERIPTGPTSNGGNSEVMKQSQQGIMAEVESLYDLLNNSNKMYRATESSAPVRSSDSLTLKNNLGLLDSLALPVDLSSPVIHHREKKDPPSLKAATRYPVKDEEEQTWSAPSQDTDSTYVEPEEDRPRPKRHAPSSTHPRKARKIAATKKTTKSLPAGQKTLALSAESHFISDYSAHYPKYSTEAKLSRLTPDRTRQILEMAAKKGLSVREVQRVLWLFELRNFDLKLRILCRVVGTAGVDNPIIVPRHHLDKGLIIYERGDGDLNMRIKTYAGADDSTHAFTDSIVTYFSQVKEFQIYYRQPNQPTTYKSKNNVLQASSKEIKQHVGSIPINCVKRPLNSFMLYRSMMVKAVILLSFMDSLSPYIFMNTGLDYEHYDVHKEQVFLSQLNEHLDQARCDKLCEQFSVRKFNHHLLIQIVSLMWKTEDAAIRDKFFDVSHIEKKIHKECYPEYRYRPNRKL